MSEQKGMKLPKAVRDRMAGLTTADHEYTLNGKTYTLTAAQVAKGVHLTEKWMASKAVSDAVRARDEAKRNGVGSLYALERMIEIAVIKLDDVSRNPNKDKCVTCGRKEKLYRTDGRAKGRCTLCQQEYECRTKYTNPVQAAQSKYATQTALKDKKRSRHCFYCHHFRHISHFNKMAFSDKLSKCVICRGAEDSMLDSSHRVKAQEQAYTTRGGLGVPRVGAVRNSLREVIARLDAMTNLKGSK